MLEFEVYEPCEGVDGGWSFRIETMADLRVEMRLDEIRGVTRRWVAW